MKGSELRQMRHKAGMTQTELASLLGYQIKGKPNKSQIARFENDHQQINPRIEAAIRFYLGKKSGEQSSPH